VAAAACLLLDTVAVLHLCGHPKRLIAVVIGVADMSTTLNAAIESYLRTKTLSRGTRNEYRSTLRKWEDWGAGAPIKLLQRWKIREFLNWVHGRAIVREGTNPLARRTRRANTCVPSSRGRGSRN